MYADYEEYKVFIQQIGLRSCGFNGFKTSKDVKFIASHDDCLEMLYGKHTYQIEFNPPPVKTFLSKKRSRDSKMLNENDENSDKIVKIEGDNKDEKTQEEEPQMEVKRKKNDQGILKYVKKIKTSDEFKDEDNMIDLDNEQDMWESKESGALLICTTQGVESRSKVN